VEVTLTGGYLYPRGGLLMGPFCEQMLERIAADVLVLGLNGVSENGLSNSNSLTVHAEQKMIQVARRVVVVADHTKFGREAMAHLAPLDVVDLMVSDTDLAAEHQAMLRAHEVDLLLA
jgi:DeoR family fructose operon transcriptional repressor